MHIRCISSFKTTIFLFSPTGPTISPTLAPQPLLPDDPSNQMFCGTDWAQAAGQCSLQSHCGDTGECDGGHLFCWHRVNCDIRDYIPFEEGGRLGKPTHKEIAEKMGLTYPSDDVRTTQYTFVPYR